MSPLLLVADAGPTTLTGALGIAVSALAGVVVWLGQRLLAAQDAHTAEIRTLYAQRGEDIERLTTALGAIAQHTEAVERAAEALSTRRPR